MPSGAARARSGWHRAARATRCHRPDASQDREPQRAARGTTLAEGPGMTTRHIYSAALSLVLGCGGGGGGGGGDDDRADAGTGADAGDEEVTTGRCEVERSGPA